MKTLKYIFLFILYEMNCSKEDFIQAANQEYKLEAYFTLMHMICKLIFTFISIIVLLFIILMLLLSIIIYYPIILLPIFIIICLPYIIMSVINYKTKKEKENEDKNRFCK